MNALCPLIVITALILPLGAVAQTAAASDYDSIGLDTLSATFRGNTECKADLALAFPFPGILAEAKIEEGSVVKSGQLLAALDSEIEAIEVERRRAIWENQSELDVARIKAEVTAQQYAAAERLAASGGAISLEDVQNRKLARDADAIEVQRLTTQEAVEELDFRTASAALAKRSLMAPSDGIVADLLKKPGESVQSYEPVVRLCDLSQIRLVANLPDAAASLLMVGDTVPLRFAAAPEPLSGTVAFISPLVDAASGLRRVKIDLPQGTQWLRPGLSADLILP